jgi:hypothetical protein
MDTETLPALSSPDTDTDTVVVPRLSNDDGNHERFAHYANKEAIMNAAVFGTPCEALCGKKWVPFRDPKKYPVCPDCQRIYDEELSGDPS